MKEKSRIRITNYHGKFFYRLIDSIFILVIMYISIKSNQHVVTMSYISVALLGVAFLLLHCRKFRYLQWLANSKAAFTFFTYGILLGCDHR